MPFILFFTGQSTKKVAKPKSKTRAKPKAAVIVAEEELVSEGEDGFSYVAELLPLHIRRGFVNLTPDHWPFFAINSRSTMREVTVRYDGLHDKHNAIWRLVPDDQARLVLSPAVHRWLEEYFSAYDHVAVVARKMNDEEIQLSLSAVE